jgi:hypothetical protein
MRRLIRALLAAWAGVLSSACGPGAGPGGPAAREPPPGADPRPAFARVCLPCHEDGDETRPSLAPMTSSSATSAMRAVLSGEMPPARARRLREADRVEILGWLCPRSGRSAASCRALLAREATPPLVRPPVHVLTALARAPAVRVDRVPDELKASLFEQLSRSPQALLDGSAVARYLAIADAACAGPPERPAAVRGCMDRVLEIAAGRPGPDPASGAAGRAPSLQEIDDIFGVAGSGAARAGRPIGAREIRAHIHDLVRRRDFYDRFAPGMLLLLDTPGAASFRFHRILFAGRSARRGPYFYQSRGPCRDRDLVEVSPWWDLGRRVLICRDDYRPDTTVAADGRVSCDFTRFALPSSYGCGCGPNLMFCAPPEQHVAAVQAAFDEIALTMRAIITEGRPFSQLLTVDDTVRSGLGDLFYARDEFFQSGRFAVPDLDAPPAWRPRGARHGGGILTTPVYLFIDSRRLIMARLWQDFLCLPLRSSGVDPHTLVAAARDRPLLRASSFEALALLPGCRNCHSRLEYGQMAFPGWQNAFVGAHYDARAAAAAPARTKFYVRDHRDRRAEGPASPSWLGRQIAAQPEFPRCMAGKVAGLVYEGAPPPREVLEALTRRFADGQRMEELIGSAVIARFLGLDAI